MVFSVRLSVCLSVCLSVTPFWLCSHHRIIMKFSGVITTDQGNVHAKGQGQRSKVKVTEVTTQLSRFRTVTPVWIHIWWWNDIYSLMLLRRGALLFFKVIQNSVVFTAINSSYFHMHLFMNETSCIFIKISLKRVPKVPTDNKRALVKIMAWRRLGDKPLSEPMLTQFTDAYMRHKWEMSWIH